MLHRLASLFSRSAKPRRTRLYCLGAPRTGTHSIAAAFGRSIRARHEPEFRATTRLVLARHRGELSSDELRRILRQRDERLRLAVDSSHVNAFLADVLLAEFHDARFVLTIRDPFSWLDSAMDHTMSSRHWSRTDRAYLEFWFDTNHDRYSPHDEFLRDLGLPSVDGHLAAWTRHNEAALHAVPAERLLVVETAAITQSLPEIAAFAGIAPEHVHRRFRARGVARARHGVLARIDPAYVAERIEANCGALLHRFPHLRPPREPRADR